MMTVTGLAVAIVATLVAHVIIHGVWDWIETRKDPLP